MKPALNVATLNRELSFEDFAQVAGEAGFEGIELIVPEKLEGHIERHGLDSAVRLLAEAEVAVAHFFLGLPMQAEGAQFSAALDDCARRCEMAVTLSMDRVGVWLPPATDRPVVRERADLAARLRDAAQMAGEHDLVLTVEFIGTVHEGEPLVRTLADVLAVIEAAGEANLAVVLDLFHFYVGGSDMADLEAMPAELLGMIHLDDAPHDRLERLKDADRVLPGEGVIPVVEMLRICAEKGYEGWAALELFGEELRSMEPAKAAAKGLAAVERVLEQALA
ncbi:MAG: sugar phosphate isomerase/epimerase [Armatimonadetes bacterium]|nr:sugar phosphate isomerase/epimerase [Armatimonadota bacterium]